MFQKIIQPINHIHHGHLGLKYENIDFLDLIESKNCTEKCCQKSKFRIGCPNSRFFNTKNIGRYSKIKLKYLNLQTVNYKPHFKNPCFNCSASFHVSSFEDGRFNIQKMFDFDNTCNTCIGNFTKERSFHHNCNTCNESFTNCKYLRQHHTKEHNSKKPYQCSACHLSLAHRTFYRHVKQHEFPHICPYCRRRCPTEEKYIIHILSHSGEKTFPCKYCPMQHKSKCALDIHLLEHTGSKKLKCNFCDKTFVNWYTLNQHHRIHIMEMSFQCEYCPKHFKIKRNLDYHLWDQHNGDKQFKCDLCYKTFSTIYELNGHKLIHIEQPIGGMEKSFSCRYCQKQYKSKNSLDVHLFEHTGGKQFKCDLCDKTFAKQFKLNQHKTVHMAKSFQCEYCPKKYKSKRSLTLHLFEHTGGKEFKCDLCDKAFSTQYLLSKHKSTEMRSYDHLLYTTSFPSEMTSWTIIRQS